MVNVEALLEGQTLTVTALGRHSQRLTSAKHTIKQSDRLVGNTHLETERVHFYRAITHGGAGLLRLYL
tara:strand:+ start:897 stop:1100 length:204 start_codon:yes stop_codon:yes gene_type:complete